MSYGLLMNSSTLVEPPRELDDFIVTLLARATDDVLSTARPLVGFGMVESAEGERSLKRVAAGGLEESQMQARRVVAADTLAIRAGVAWDGYFTLEGDRTDAVYVEVSERGADTSFVFAQRYGRKGFFKKTTFLVGRPMLVANGNLFA